MKKLMLPLCLVAMISCSKKDDDATPSTTTSTTSPTSTTSSGSVVFDKTKLVGTWDINKDEAYDITNDTLIDTEVHPKGDAALAFNADNTITAIDMGGAVDAGNYAIAKKGNKDYLILIRPGWGNDSMEVISFTGTSMVLSDKLYQISENNEIYAKTYLTKR